MMARANVAPSRKSTHSIMANSGFGKLVIHNSGFKATVPQSQITRDGRIKKAVEKRLNRLSSEDIKFLEERGIQIHRVY